MRPSSAGALHSRPRSHGWWRKHDAFWFLDWPAPGSKGNRSSRMSGRRGGMALIRKYGILMKRQEFREKARRLASASIAEILWQWKDCKFVSSSTRVLDK